MRKCLNYFFFFYIDHQQYSCLTYHINIICKNSYFWFHVLFLQDKIVISQNDLLTDDAELKRLPYRSGKKKGGNASYIQIKLHVCFYKTQHLSQSFNC